MKQSTWVHGIIPLNGLFIGFNRNACGDESINLICGRLRVRCWRTLGASDIPNISKNGIRLITNYKTTELPHQLY